MYLWLLSFLHFSLLPLIILLYVDIFFEICLCFFSSVLSTFSYLHFSFCSQISFFSFSLWSLFVKVLLPFTDFPFLSSHSLLSCPLFPPSLCLPCPVVLLFPTLHFTSLLLLHSSPQPLFFTSLFHFKADHGNSRPCIEIIMFLLQWDRRPVNHNDPVSVGNHTSPFSLLFSPKERENADETREAKLLTDKDENGKQEAESFGMVG